jgi:membrane protein YdbS with pleckstrin-like domain
MHVLTSKCPYCHRDVDSTIENLDRPVICPKCNKPFEIEMPTAVVTSVHQVDEGKADRTRMAIAPQERTLWSAHPVVFRARPIQTLVLILVGTAAVGLMAMSFAGQSLAGYRLDETQMIGPLSLLMWVCVVTLLVIACVIVQWKLMSQFTTLTVTDDRTIYQKGIISRETSEVQHNDVRNIQLDQSFMQRMLNVGSLGISSAGQDELEIVAKDMSAPGTIIDCIRRNQV